MMPVINARLRLLAIAHPVSKTAHRAAELLKIEAKVYPPVPAATIQPCSTAALGCVRPKVEGTLSRNTAEGGCAT